MGRRVVITGIGIICGVGNTSHEVWKNLLAGKNGVGPITHFDASQFSTKIAAEVKNFDPLNFVEKKELRKMGRFIHLAIAAADEAVRNSALDMKTEDGTRVGVHIASGIGGFDVIEREHNNLLQGGPRRISPFFIPASIVNLAAGHVSIRHGAKGPNGAACTACTSSAHSVGDAFRIVSRCEADVMIAGGAEAAITPMGVGGFAAMRALSTRNDEPENASRPWDKDRDGFVMGEGAGILVLEEFDHASARGANILAEVMGYGMSATPTTSPPRRAWRGRPARHGRTPWRDAKIRPEQIGYINAHGTATDLGDVLETEAIKSAFGEHAYRIAVSSTKSMTGHVLGGTGGVEAAITALVLRERIVPPTMNLENPGEGCDLDYVPLVARQLPELEYAMSNSFGFGGTNGCLIFRRWTE